MKYMLRSVVVEDRWQQQLRNIIQLCQTANIENVLLMEPIQFWWTAQPLERHHKFADIYRHMAASLRAHNIGYNVNIVSLVGHEAAPFMQEENTLPFQNFVGASLTARAGVYCILDPAWQLFASQVAVIYAATQPEILMIDDDFRSLNHSEFFGCFCPLHVQKTSERVGKPLTAEQLLQHVTGSSAEDLQVRKAWMEINFAGQLEAAHYIRESVTAVCPTTRVGLMTSGEASHAVQGRNMEQLLRTFSGPEHRPVSRPAGTAYTDVIHAGPIRMHQTMALSMNQLSSETQIISEVENYPNTRFMKSLRTLQTQLELHTLAGADDLSLNLFDYFGTPYEQEPDFSALLSEQKASLARIQQARQGKELCGLGLPWKENTAEKLLSYRSQLYDILPDRTLDSILPQFGIPVQFDIGAVNLIFGDDVEAYNDEEIKLMLSRGFIMDGKAARHLVQRGFEEWIGARPIGAITLPVVERLHDTAFSGSYAGNLIPTEWFRIDHVQHPIVHLEPSQDATTISAFVDEQMQEVAPSVVLFENSLGGRVAVFSMAYNANPWQNRGRAYQMAKITEWAARKQLPIWIENAPNIAPIYYEDAETGEGLLAVVSGNLDPLVITPHTELELVDLFTAETVESFLMEPLSVRFFTTR